MHLAVHVIRNGECDPAIVAGVDSDVILSPSSSLIARVGGQTDIFANPKAAVNIYFEPNEHPPFNGSVFETLRQFAKLIKNASEARTRVVGGTGRFTASLGQALIDIKLELRYVDICTDISTHMPSQLRYNCLRRF
ncbi:hypothetical protein VNI00_000720 [Paramarasmius palmivorus]|uniref:Dirigent protein n=1 Tax=Paramarasmius palmivorus TaxID=297713 RepID=A0AAW0E763_9AGAR